MSFRLKTILGVALIEIILLSLLVFSGMAFLRTSNENQLVERAHTTAKLFAAMTTDAIVSMDLATLDEMVAKTMTNAGIKYVRIIHSSGNTLAQAGDDTMLAHVFSEDASIEDAYDDQVFDAQHEIRVGGQYFGVIQIGLDTSTVEKTLNTAYKQLSGMAVFEITLVAIFGYILGGILTRQLASLQKGARKVAEGDFGYQIKIKGKDELADTAKRFNDMSAALSDYATNLDIARQKAEDKRLRAESILQDALTSISQGILIAGKTGNVLMINKAYSDMHKLQDDFVKNVKTLDELCAGLSHDVERFTYPKDGEEHPVTKLEDGTYLMHSHFELSSGGSVWLDTDVTHILEAEEKTRKLERDLLQSQKMESIGTLAGGIAHEINTPIQYIGDNLRFLDDAGRDLVEMLDQYASYMDTQDVSAPIEKCKDVYEDLDIDFLKEEIPVAIEQSIQGVKQVSHIVLAMKEFAHPASKSKTDVDINRVIERSGVVCKSEWKQICELDLNLDPNLPAVQAQENDLNQVFLNLIVNAAHAIDEAKPDSGRIEINSFVRSDHVVVQVIDNGTGVPEKIKEKIFDPFFTTKGVGKGTGQGLAISYDILVNKHDCEFNVEDAPIGGAKFEIIFPKKKDG